MQNCNDIIDKKLYNKNDMIKIQCNECKGCSSCCQGMGASVILTPYDVWQMEKNLEISFQELINMKVELNVVEGMILPNLKMEGEQERCGFLNEENRCSIHPFRPGVCRLFPLGRQYMEHEIKYILLEGACQKANKTKVKINKWLSIPEMEENEKFLLTWHGIQKKVLNMAQKSEEGMIKELNMYLLNLFYINSYPEEGFYQVFGERAHMAEKLLEKLR